MSFNFIEEYHKIELELWNDIINKDYIEIQKKLYFKYFYNDNYYFSFIIDQEILIKIAKHGFIDIMKFLLQHDFVTFTFDTERQEVLEAFEEYFGDDLNEIDFELKKLIMNIKLNVHN